jgi:hypothetical protein
MQINATLLGFLFPGSGTSGASTLLAIAQGQTSGASAAPQRNPIAVLEDAEKNATKQIAAKAQEPLVKRDIDAFVKGVMEAETVEDLFANTKAMKVLLTANGLEEFASYKALYSKTLNSDHTDAESLAVKLGSSNAAWFNTAKTYQFFSKGLDVLKTPETIAAIADGYAEVRWRESLDASAPGVSAALSFKEMASTLDSPFKILGNGVAREVVTTALGLPQELAYQSLQAQSLAVTKRLDIERLQDASFVDTFVRRYLIALNSAGGGLTA